MGFISEGAQISQGLSFFDKKPDAQKEGSRDCIWLQCCSIGPWGGGRRLMGEKPKQFGMEG